MRNAVVLTLGATAISAAVACEDSEALPPEEHLPNIPREPVDPAERLGASQTAAEAMPVRTKVVSDGPADTIILGEYRGGGGGGGGGDRTRGRPPGFPRGANRQQPEDQHAASRDAVSQTRRRGTEACQLAFEAARDLQRARQTKTPGRTASIDRESFLEMCDQRPEIEQWCLVPSYVQQHHDDCDRQAHTRYARAIDRYENRADGEADDWAPEADPTAPPTSTEVPAPTMGPVRIPRPGETETPQE